MRQNENELCRALGRILANLITKAICARSVWCWKRFVLPKRHLARWMRPRRAPVSASQMPARGFVISEPLGTSLIMSPWNYPVLLSLEPLVGRDRRQVLRHCQASAYAPATSTALREMLGSCFPRNTWRSWKAAARKTPRFWNSILTRFFLHGKRGRQEAGHGESLRFLTPVTLELGGKSPCIVDETADIALSAKRIAFGKFLNAGQTLWPRIIFFARKA